MSEPDIAKFDEYLSDFLALSKDIVISSERRNLKLSSRKNPFLTRLEKYTKAYDKTEPENHIWYFNKIYQNNKPAILRGPIRDNWIKNNGVVIMYGEDVGRQSDIKVHVSSIYNTSCKLRDDIEDSLSGLPNVEQAKELSFPTLYLLYLYQIFHELCENETEKEKLGKYVETLKVDAGVKKAAKTNNNDPLSGLMGQMAGMAEQMGIKIPEGQMPSGDQITGALSNMMNNPQTKSMLGNVMSEMKDANNIGDVFGKLMGQLAGGGIPGAPSGEEQTDQTDRGDDETGDGDYIDEGEPEFMDE